MINIMSILFKSLLKHIEKFFRKKFLLVATSTSAEEPGQRMSRG